MENTLNPENLPEENKSESADEDSASEEAKETKKVHEGHPHHHPHILTIEHTNHGRTTRTFGGNHEPGTI